MSAPRLHYAPGLDGVRALAVAAVVSYHVGVTSNVSVLPGGYLGVDVFFVLSGYLITSLLLVEVAARGRISIKDFYLRRARRLLPALYAMLLVVAVIGAFWLPQQAGRLRGDLLASIAYVQNWWLVLQSSSYFASVGDRPPLLTHLWSLAVEEQFYLVWPWVLIALTRWRARRAGAARPWIMVGVVLGLVAASVIVGQLLYDPLHDPSRVYYGTDTRALAPLLGAALAIAVQPWRQQSELMPLERWSLDLVGGLGLVALAALAVWLHDTQQLLYRGGLVAIALAAAALVLAAGHPASRLGWLLGRQPLRYLGERSYAIYLWHWPVCLLTRPGYDIPLTGWANAGVRLAITLVLAEASYQLIERPIRRHGFLAPLRRPQVAPAAEPAVAAPAAEPAVAAPRRAVVPVARTVALTVALVAGGVTAGVGLSLAASRPAAGVALGDPQPTVLASPTAPPRPQPGLPIGATVDFFGDSQAETLLKNAPPDIGDYIDVHDASTPGCGILYGTFVNVDGVPGSVWNSDTCVAWSGYYAARAEQDQPDLSILMTGRFDIQDLLLDGATSPLVVGTPAWDEYYVGVLNQAIALLGGPDRKVALALLPCYRPPTDLKKWYPTIGDVRVRHINTLMTQVADSYATGVYVLDPPAQLCTAPTASDPTIRVDGTHFAPAGSALYFRNLLAQILAPGQSPGSPSPLVSPSLSVSGATPGA